MGQLRDKDIREEALRQAQAEIAQEVKQEIVDIFRELLERLWARLASLVGETATMAIFRSALWETTGPYAFLKGTKVSENGLRLDCLQENLAALDRATIRAGLLAFIDSIVALITDLTGDILVRKVQPLVEQFNQQLEEG